MNGESLRGPEAIDEKELEEARLLNRVFEANDEKNGRLAGKYSWLCDELTKSGLENGRTIADGVDQLRIARKEGETDYTRALVEFIDTRFSGKDTGFALDNLMLHDVRKNNRAIDNLAYVATKIRQEDGEGFYDLSRRIDSYADSRANSESGLTNALVKYIFYPSKENRQSIEAAKYERQAMMNQCFSQIFGGIEEVSEKRGEEVRKRSEKTIDTMSSIKNTTGLSDEECDAAIMKYIQFRMEKAGIVEAAEPPRSRPEVLKPFGDDDNLPPIEGFLD